MRTKGLDPKKSFGTWDPSRPDSELWRGGFINRTSLDTETPVYSSTFSSEKQMNCAR